jgi:hypothetical protein
MTQFREIAVSNLLLDSQNPRLADGQDTQPEIIRTMLMEHGEKLLILAGDIADRGSLNPTEQILVVADEKRGKKFLVLEGNRRVTALKILGYPELAESGLSKPQFNRLRKLSAQFQKNPVRKAPCAVLETREEADHWIELRHTGEQGGAGIVPWGGTETARFRARRGQTSAALTILDFVRDHGGLDEATRKKLSKVAITNLERLIDDPYVREKLGFDKKKEAIITDLPPEELAKGLGRIVRDLAHEAIKVTDIDNKGLRKTYVDRFPSSDLPDKTKATGASKPFTGGAGGGNTVTAAKTSPKGATLGSKPRTTLISKNCSLTISNVRISKIAGELRKLNLEQFSNSAAVLLRVFLELSVDEYITVHKTMQDQQRDNSKLHEKINNVINRLHASKKMTDVELQPVRRIIQDQHHLAASVKTLHGYVHNPHFNPSPSELRTAWDNLELFMKNIWS